MGDTMATPELGTGQHVEDIAITMTQLPLLRSQQRHSLLLRCLSVVSSLLSVDTANYRSRSNGLGNFRLLAATMYTTACLNDVPSKCTLV